MNNIKIVIPARYNSTRLPGKPLLDLCGKPVIYHVVQQCLNAGVLLQNIVVATDDSRVFDSLSSLNIPVKYTSSNHKSGTDRIHEIAISEGWGVDTIVVNVQGDEPLIPPELIKDVCSFAISNPTFKITTAVTRICDIDDFDNPNVVKAILGEGNRALYFTRAASPVNREYPSDLSLAFRHIGIYTYSVGALKTFCSYPESPLESYEKLEQLRALTNGIPIGAIIYNDSIPHGIDTEEDYQQVKIIMEQES